MKFELKDFDTQVMQRSKTVPVLVDFWAPWCSPCRTLGPVLEDMAGKAAGRWELVKVNTEENADLAAVFDIRSIPAAKLFVNGEVVDGFVGALPEREIRQFLEKALPSAGASQVKEAERLLNAGEDSAAAALLEPVVAEEPANAQARVLLAQALLNSQPQRVAPLLQDVAADSDCAPKANALRTLSRLATLADEPSALPEAKWRERYLQGAASVRAGDYARALPAFIEVLERSKIYDNGGAKEACKAIFALLGMQHELVQRYFRAFSSALHS